jgi:hypothetical protein
MATAEWIASGLCLGLLGLLSLWLLLDNWRERRQAVARAWAKAYSANSETQPPDEETWPIVAQQPQLEFPNAATIRIPRQVVDDAEQTRLSRHAAWHQAYNPEARTVPELLAGAVEAGDSLRLAWPQDDPDSGGPVEWYVGDDLPTGVLPVIHDDDAYEVS